MSRRTTRTLPPILGRFDLAPDTLDRERRMVEGIFLSGQPIARFPLLDEPFWLEFELTAAAADFRRVQAGNVPVLDSHQRMGVASVLGKVESARIASGQARARLRFSRRADVDPIWQDVEDGILGSLSAGVTLHDVEELEPREDDDMRRFRALRWELLELSLLGVPADGGAHIEADADARYPCRLTTFDEGGETMRLKRCPSCKTKLAADYDDKTCPNAECGVDMDAAEGERLEDQRVGKLHRVAAYYGTAETTLRAAVKNGTDPEAFTELAESERSRVRGPVGLNALGFGTEYDSPGARVECMAEALAARATGKEPTEGARRYYGERLVDLAHAILRPLGYARGLDVRHHGARIVELALHTTSDFPNILGNTVNRLLLPLYESAQTSFRLVAQRRDFRDFRVHSFVRAGDFPVPLQKGEHGEYKYGTMGESAETAVLVSYGRIFGITRESIVNDDLGAFADLAMKAAVRTLDFLNSRFFELLIAPNAGLGTNMSDSQPVYDSAAHANESPGGTLDVALLGAARALMMAQTSIDGIKLNNSGRFLLVSPTSLTLAEQLSTTINPSTVAEANPFQSRIVPLGDANLSGARFYVLGDPAAGRSNYFHGGLAGQPGPRIDVRPGWEVDGVEVRLAVDAGFGVQDYRFGVTGAGS